MDTSIARLPMEEPVHSGPRIGLVLGGGGARGLAHILMFEVFDELGIKPTIIAGTSIGAILGAAYASGLSASQIRAHTETVLTRRFGLVRGLFAGGAAGRVGLWRLFSARGALVNPETLLDIMMPPQVARDFAGLSIPLIITASDFYALEPAVFTSGPLRTAVAASMAIPVLFEPVVLGGRTLVDGGLTNPLPFDLVQGKADIIVAIDVSGVTIDVPGRARPSAMEALFSTGYLYERSIVREKLKQSQPDIYLDAGTGHFQVLDLLKFREILAAAQPAKAQLRARLLRILQAEAGVEVAEEIALDARSQAEARRRRILERWRRKLVQGIMGGRG